MNMLIKSSLVAFILSASTTAFATDLSVTGTVLPPSCDLALDETQVEYIDVDPKLLSETNYIPLEEKTVGFGITCNGLAKLALKASNTASDKDSVAIDTGTVSDGLAVAPTSLAIFGTTGGYQGVASLGLQNGKNKIGGFGLRIKPGTLKVVDKIGGTPVDAKVIMRTGGSGAWSDHNAGSYSGTFWPYNWLNITTLSWATSGTTQAVISSVTGQFGIMAYVNRTKNLDLSSRIEFNGETTIELVYL